MLSSNNMLTTGGRRQRQRGTVRVSEPANGFFITGSCIDDMNGVYVRKNPPRVKKPNDPQIALYYEHEDGLWHMALKSLTEDDDKEDSDEDDYFYRRKRKPEHEWVFIDPFGKERFSHEGDTIIPGAGVRWKHIHPTAPTQMSSAEDVTSAVCGDLSDDDSDNNSPAATSINASGAESTTAVATIQEDNEDELPWQVIAILDWDTVQELLWGSEYRKRKVRDAQQGKTAKPPAQNTLEASFSAGNNWLFRVIASEGVDVYETPDDSAGGEIGHVEAGQYLRGVELRAEGEWLKLDRREDVFTASRTIPKTKTKSRSFLSDSDEEEDEDEGWARGSTGHTSHYNAEFSRRELWVRVWEKGWGVSGKCIVVEEVLSTDSAVMDLKGVGDKGSDRVIDETLNEMITGSGDASGEPSGGEGLTGDYFDKPFVPRMEDGSSDSTVNEEVLTEEAIQQLMRQSSVEDVELVHNASIGVPVGSAVVVTGLHSRAGMQYNGVTGVVMSEVDATTGRQGVHMNAPFSGKVLSCKPDSLMFAIATETTDNIIDDRLTKSLRLLGLTPRELGLSAPSTSPETTATASDITDRVVKEDGSVGRGVCEYELPWGFGGNTPSEKVSMALRAGLRDVGSSVSSSSMRESLREAAGVVFSALTHRPTPSTSSISTGGDDGLRLRQDKGMSPEELVRRGALGSRAAAALAAAYSRSSLSEREAGLKSLQEILHDEILRSRQARDAIIDRHGEDSGGFDEWLLRMCVVNALLETRREVEGLEEAKINHKFVTTLKYDPSSNGGDGSCVEWKNACVQCTNYQLGVCLLRRGVRAEGISVIEKASSSSTTTTGCVDWLGCLGKWAMLKAQKMVSINKSIEQIKVAALDAYARGSFTDAVALYSKAIALLQVRFPDDKRGRATAYADKAGCQRRGRKLAEAVADLDAALRLFPHYTRAIYRRAVCLLEAGKASEAVEGFKDLYRVDRNWPNLSEWLVKAFSLQKRQAKGYHSNSSKQTDSETNFEEPSSEKAAAGAGGNAFAGEGTGSEADLLAKEVDHYAVLGVSTDATEKQLKTAYRMRSLKFHPDRKEGHTAAFQRIAEAYEVLADPEKRRGYDEGVDIKVKRGRKDDDDDSEEEEEEHKTSLREEVEREFFPERYHFWPFGDPFIYKRKREAQKRAKEEQDRARAGRGGTRGNKATSSNSAWEEDDFWT